MFSSIRPVSVSEEGFFIYSANVMKVLEDARDVYIKKLPPQVRMAVLERGMEGYCFATFVQPVGTPGIFMSGAWVRVPVFATPYNQLSKQPSAEISVASMVTLLSEVQSENISA